MPPTRTVTYRQIAGLDLQMDLYLPPGPAPAAPRPGVLFVHGGGWSGGNRGQFAWHAEQLAQAGYVAASTSYRLSKVAPYPAVLDDCQAAVRWLRRHAAELGLDPARLGAVGSSAGGHLVACLGTRETRDDSIPELAGLSSRVQCVVDVHGVHDFPALPAQKLAGATYQLFGGTREDREAGWAEASPIRYVGPDSAPMLLIHDPADPTVPYDQTVRFAATLIQAGRPVSFIPSPGSGHGFFYNPHGDWTRRLWPDAVAFLARHLT